MNNVSRDRCYRLTPEVLNIYETDPDSWQEISLAVVMLDKPGVVEIGAYTIEMTQSEYSAKIKGAQALMMCHQDQREEEVWEIGLSK